MTDVAPLLPAGWHVTAGECVYPPDSVYGPITQPTIEIGIVHDGAVRTTINGVDSEIVGRQAFRVLPGQRALYRFSACHHCWVHLWSERGYPDPMLERIRRLPFAIPLSAGLAREVRELLDLAPARLTTREELMLLCGQRILYQFIGEAELAGGIGVGFSDPVERALDFIDEHLSDPLTLESIAAAAAVSASHLIRLFHEQLATTPVRHVWDRRLERGLSLLEETGLTIGEIAHRCGFRTSHHFSRRVHQRTAASPTEVRRRAQSGLTPARQPVHAASDRAMIAPHAR